jgi:hypothetical protein
VCGRPIRRQRRPAGWSRSDNEFWSPPRWYRRAFCGPPRQNRAQREDAIVGGATEVIRTITGCETGSARRLNCTVIVREESESSQAAGWRSVRQVLAGPRVYSGGPWKGCPFPCHHYRNPSAPTRDNLVQVAASACARHRRANRIETEKTEVGKRPPFIPSCMQSAVAARTPFQTRASRLDISARPTAWLGISDTKCAGRPARSSR